MLNALLYHALSNILVIAHLIYSFQHYRFKCLSGLFGLSCHFFMSAGCISKCQFVMLNTLSTTSVSLNPLIDMTVFTKFTRNLRIISILIWKGSSVCLEVLFVCHLCIIAMSWGLFLSQLPHFSKRYWR